MQPTISVTSEVLPLCCSLPRGDPVRQETHQLHVGHVKEPQPPRGGALQRWGGSHRRGHPHRAHDQLPGAQRGGCDGARFHLVGSSPGATGHLPVLLSSAASGGPRHAVRAEAAEDADGADHLPVQVCLPGPHPVPQELSSDLKSTVEARQMKRTAALFFSTTDQTYPTACWGRSRRRIGAIFQITFNQCVQISICNSWTFLCAVCVILCKVI